MRSVLTLALLASACVLELPNVAAPDAGAADLARPLRSYSARVVYFGTQMVLQGSVVEIDNVVNNALTNADGLFTLLLPEDTARFLKFRVAVTPSELDWVQPARVLAGDDGAPKTWSLIPRGVLQALGVALDPQRGHVFVHMPGVARGGEALRLDTLAHEVAIADSPTEGFKPSPTFIAGGRYHYLFNIPPGTTTFSFEVPPTVSCVIGHAPDQIVVSPDAVTFLEIACQ